MVFYIDHGVIDKTYETKAQGVCLAIEINIFFEHSHEIIDF